jgi:hypothetical protein
MRSPAPSRPPTHLTAREFRPRGVPPIAEQLDASVVQLHSTDYRGPADIPDRPVLVVAAGTPATGISHGASGTEMRFADGSVLAPSAVIWATGFALDHSFVQAPILDADGRVEHRRGVTAVPGLYFPGLPWQPTRGSALLGWVKDDTQYIATEIARAAPPISEPLAVRTAA